MPALSIGSKVGIETDFQPVQIPGNSMPKCVHMCLCMTILTTRLRRPVMVVRLANEWPIECAYLHYFQKMPPR